MHIQYIKLTIWRLSNRRSTFCPKLPKTCLQGLLATLFVVALWTASNAVAGITALNFGTFWILLNRFVSWFLCVWESLRESSPGAVAFAFAGLRVSRDQSLVTRYAGRQDSLDVLHFLKFSFQLADCDIVKRPRLASGQCHEENGLRVRDFSGSRAFPLEKLYKAQKSSGLQPLKQKLVLTRRRKVVEALCPEN